MKWIQHYDLFLLDFDGLLVDTEKLHFAAYQKLCHINGYTLPWSFNEYIAIAHGSSHGLRRALEPVLGGDWSSLYFEKKKIYLEILSQGHIKLMDGVESFLHALSQAHKKRCVVTHSPREQIQRIKKFLPILDTIPTWITREDYEHPKPSPDGYFKAIETLADSNDRIIGFEDSLRGLQALQKTRALSVLICDSSHPQMQKIESVLHFNSFREIPRRELI